MEWRVDRSNIAMYDRHLYSLQTVTTNVALRAGPGQNRERFDRL